MCTEKKIILQLLEAYKEIPCLWDRKHKDYANKEMRNKGNSVLLEVYQKLEPEATMKSMIKKISNLRTNYYKEFKKVKDSKRSGSATEYVPTLYYYDALSFIEPFYEPATRFLETEDIQKSSDEETVYLMSDSSQRKKKRYSQSSHETPQNLVAPQEHTTFKKKEEDFEVLGKAIGLQLRDLDNSKLRITQKIISDAIYYAGIGALTHNSFIDLGPPVTQDMPFAAPTGVSSYRSPESQMNVRAFPIKRYASSDSE